VHHLDLDWGELLAFVDVWQDLSTDARQAFLRDVESRPASLDHLGDVRDELEAAGLIETLADGVRQRLPERLRAVRRALRSLDRHVIFADAGSDEALLAYIVEHVTAEERSRLAGSSYYTRPEDVAGVVGSVTWVNTFLGCETRADWEKHLSVRAYGHPWPGWTSVVFRTTRSLITFFETRSEPVHLSELRELFADWPASRLGSAVHAACHDLLLFCDLDPGDLSPRIGLWPPVAAYLTAPPPPAPGVVEPEERFVRPFLAEDLTAVVAACAATPLRLRQHDLSLYARARKEIAAAVTVLPRWIVDALQQTPDRRIDRARMGAWALGLLEEHDPRRGHPTLRITSRGKEWLARDERGRLLTLVDPIRYGDADDDDEAAAFELFMYGNFLVHSALHPTRTMVGPPPTSDAIHAVCRDGLTSLPDAGRGAMVLAEFVTHQARANNPLLLVPGAVEHYDGVRRYGLRGGLVPEERLVASWRQELLRLVAETLLPIGAVELGFVRERPDGARGSVQDLELDSARGSSEDEVTEVVLLTVALTPVGRYLLRLTDELALPEVPEGDIVVQPNFEIVFLGPAPTQEAQLGRVAERIGHRVGTLFRLTRESVVRALGQGLTRDEILAMLETAARTGLPANVRREVTGWLERTRAVVWRRALVVTCPDAETADRLTAAVGRKDAVRLGETAVELKMDRLKPALAKKLQKQGILVQEAED